MNKFVAVLALSLALPFSAYAESCAIKKLQFESPKGIERGSFTYELADTDELRQKGLMYRRFLQADHGMLFVWEKPQRLAMWMKHTYIPLDMIYMKDGFVTGIVHRAKPHSEKVVGHDLPEATAILEVIAETAEKRNIQVGDKAIKISDPAACN